MSASSNPQLILCRFHNQLESVESQPFKAAQGSFPQGLKPAWYEAPAARLNTVSFPKIIRDSNKCYFTVPSRRFVVKNLLAKPADGHAVSICD